MDRSTGATLELLQPEDFVVLANGQAREVKSLRVQANPIDLIFVLSEYIRRPPNQSGDTFQALLRSLSQLRDTDRAGVVWIGTSPKDAPALSNNREAPIRAVSSGQRRVRLGNGSPSLELYDAVSLAAAGFPEPVKEVRSRAIIAVTVDAEKGSQTTLRSLIQIMVERKISLSAVFLDRREGSRPVSPVPIPGVPRGIATGGTLIVGESLLPAVEATGGESVQEHDVLQTLPRLIRSLQQSYRLSYDSGSLDGEERHSVEVRLSHQTQQRFPNAVVRIRPTGAL